MWFYLFGSNDKYPDPLTEIRALAELEQTDGGAYMKLSPRDDAPGKNAEEGEVIFLCIRIDGRWHIQGEAKILGRPFQGEVPESARTLYGTADARQWWWRLAHVRLYPVPKTEAEIGLAEGTLPRSGRAQAIRIPDTRVGVENRENGAPDKMTLLRRLTEEFEKAWDEGELTQESLESAIRQFRREHLYGHASPGVETTYGVCGGDACIVRTRLPVWVLEQARRLGCSEADLLRSYPTLRAEDLVNAWSFVRANRDEVDRQIRENEGD